MLKIRCPFLDVFSLTAAHMQRRRRFRRAGVPSNATLSLLGKELREAHLQALLGGTSRSSTLSNASDPLLSSLVYNVPSTETEEAPPKPIVVVEEQPAKLSSLSQQSKSRQVVVFLCLCFITSDFKTILCTYSYFLLLCLSGCEHPVYLVWCI